MRLLSARKAILSLLPVGLAIASLATAGEESQLRGSGIDVKRNDASLSSHNSQVIADGSFPAWVRTGGPLGGLGYDIRMHPDNPDIMFVTDAFAGVFKSTDGGQTWLPVNEGITTRVGFSGDAIPVFCLTIDPNSPDIIWVGTQGVRGIFKSTNGGDTWAKMDNGVEEEEGIAVRGLGVDPTDSDVVYAAAEISSWVWAGEGRTGSFDMTQGVVYKTTNGGQDWQAVWRGDNLARYVVIDPRDADVLYVSTGIFDRDAANTDVDAGQPGGVGILKSTDAGLTWTTVNNGLGSLYVGSLFMHPNDPDILLAGVGHDAYHDGGGVYLTTDAGESWQHTLALEETVVIESVEFARSNPAVAYAGGERAIFRSEDGGYTWELVDGGAPDGWRWGPPGVEAGFPIDLQVDPRNPDRVFANNYGGGNFLSTNGGRTWASASTGYTGAMVRDVAVDPAAPARVFAVGRTGLFGSTNGGQEWIGLVASAERYVVSVSPDDPHHVLVGSLGGELLVMRNGEQSWADVQPRLDPDTGWQAIAFAPASADVVYAGSAAYAPLTPTFEAGLPAAGIYRSLDGGATWTPANDDTSSNAHVTALVVDPNDPQVIYAATGSQGVLMSTDGGTSWTTRNTGLRGNPTVLSLAMNPNDSAALLAGLDFGGPYRSDDGGSTWYSSGAGMGPEAIVTDVVFDPTDPQTAYATDRFTGVYVSQDSGTTWVGITEGLSNRDVNALSISADGRHLYAGTEGGGVFRLDLSGEAPAATGEADETIVAPIDDGDDNAANDDLDDNEGDPDGVDQEDDDGLNDGATDNADDEETIDDPDDPDDLDNGGSDLDEEDSDGLGEGATDEESMPDSTGSGRGRSGGTCGLGVILLSLSVPICLVWRKLRRF